MIDVPSRKRLRYPWDRRGSTSNGNRTLRANFLLVGKYSRSAEYYGFLAFTHGPLFKLGQRFGLRRYYLVILLAVKFTM